MKELYIAPEAQVLSFVPLQRLAGTPAEDYAINLLGEKDDDIDSVIDSNGEGDPND